MKNKSVSGKSPAHPSLGERKSEKHTWSCIGTWDDIWLYTVLCMKVFYKYPGLMYYYDYNQQVRLFTVVDLETQLDHGG